MNFTAHQVAQRIMDQAVAGEGRFSRKGGRYDVQTVMSAAASGAFVPGMPGRIVDQPDFAGRQGGQPFAQVRFKIAGRAGLRQSVHAGRTFLNGLTLTPA